MAVRIVDMELIHYEGALELQREAVEKVQENGSGETLFLLEHHPVITLGRNSDGSAVLADDGILKDRGVAILETDRGGDVTFHGPGQLVGYPVILLREGERDIARYVRNLEEALIRTLASFAIEGRHHDRYRGVWVEDRKIASVGVRISRWVTSHGFALNVTTDLSYFSLINPCGIAGCRMTSMEHELGQAPSIKMVKKVFADKFSEVFEREVRCERPSREEMSSHAG